MSTEPISDHEIQALVDDKLGYEDMQRILEYMESHPWAQQRFDQLVEQKRLLRSWWKAKKH